MPMLIEIAFATPLKQSIAARSKANFFMIFSWLNLDEL